MIWYLYMIVYLYMYMHMSIFMNMYAYMLLRSTTQYYVGIVLRSNSTTHYYCCCQYCGDHTMGVGGGGPGTCNAHPYIYIYKIPKITYIYRDYVYIYTYIYIYSNKPNRRIPKKWTNQDSLECHMVHLRMTLVGIGYFLEWKPRFLGSILNLGCVHAKENTKQTLQCWFFSPAIYCTKGIKRDWYLMNRCIFVKVPCEILDNSDMWRV